MMSQSVSIDALVRWLSLARQASTNLVLNVAEENIVFMKVVVKQWLHMDPYPWPIVLSSCEGQCLPGINHQAVKR